MDEGDKLKLCSEKFDAIVIGSGMGGLCTASILSKAGKNVLVLEQHYTAGGQLNDVRDVKVGMVTTEAGRHS